MGNVFSGVGVQRPQKQGYDHVEICILERWGAPLKRAWIRYRSDLYRREVRHCSAMRVPTTLTHDPMAFQQVVPPLDILIIENDFLFIEYGVHQHLHKIAE